MWHILRRQYGNINYKTGDSVEIPTCIATGFITNSKGRIYCSIPLDKPVIAKSFTFSDVVVNIRQNGAYLQSNEVLTDSVFLGKKITPAGLVFYIEKTFTDATNNDLVSVEFKNMTLSFN